MPKTKQPETIQDMIRKHAGRATGARYAEILEEVSEVIEGEGRKDAAETAANALEELDTVFDQLGSIRDALEALVEFGMATQAVVDDLSSAVDLIDNANGVVSRDDLQTFVEAYDEACQALDTYGETKDSDSYPGKRDDVESAWGDATAALESLADALDSVEIDTVTQEKDEDD